METRTFHITLAGKAKDAGDSRSVVVVGNAWDANVEDGDLTITDQNGGLLAAFAREFWAGVVCAEAEVSMYPAEMKEAA